MRTKILILSVLLFFSLITSVNAEDAYTDELFDASQFDSDTIIDALPDEVKEKLPGGDIFSSDGFFDRFSIDYFFELIKKTAAEALSYALKSLLTTFSLVIISSVLAMLKKAVKNDGAASVFEFASSLCIMLTLYRGAVTTVEAVKIYIGQLSSLVSAMVPVTVAIGTAGGNISASAVSAGGMMIGLAFVEVLSASGLMPVLRLCFGLSIASGIGGINLGGISKLVRGIFTWVLALTSAVISAVMTFQTSIAASADSLSMRAVKFAASSTVPVVGGMAGDAVRAVAGSLSLVKSTVGWVGVILIAMITLPITVRVLFTRLGIRISETAAEILGLEKEKNLLSDAGGLYGFLAAAVIISGLMFVYAMALFAKSATAAV